MANSISSARVLVTPTSFGKNNPVLIETLRKAVGDVIFNPTTRPLSSADLSKLLPDIDGYIAGLDQIDTLALQTANRLKVIARYGVGVDRVDLAVATKRNIIVTNTPGANSAAVAELTIGLILALARHLTQADQAIRCGEWPRYNGIGLRDCTIGLVGFGSIGQAVARRVAGFECHLVATDPYARSENAAQHNVSLVSLPELLAQADFVSLHASATPETNQMVNTSFLSMMKPGAFLINTARGELIDEAALLGALNSGHLAGAALDCFHQEPPSPGSPLLQHPHIIATPHTGSHTDEAINRMGWMALEACLTALRGERPEHVVNPEVFNPTQEQQ